MMMAQKTSKDDFNSDDQVTSVMFVSVDTVSIDDDENDAAAMKELLESELVAAGDNAWMIVFGHFPSHSGGGYSGIASTRDQIEPILYAQNVDFYLSGHDHNLQHWSTRDNPSGVDQIVTGILVAFLKESYILSPLIRSWWKESLWEI